MKTYRLLLALFAGSFLYAQIASAQTESERNVIRQGSNVSALESLSQFFMMKYQALKTDAEKFAKDNNLPKTVLNPDGTFSELQRYDPLTNTLYYYCTQNANAAISTNVPDLRPGGVLGLNLLGQNMIVGEWDGGPIRTTHQELTGRVTVQDGVNFTTSNGNNQHACHVAGTMIASGVTASAKGMAPSATLWSNEWNNDLTEMASQAALGLLMSNHSYGYNPAFLGITDWGFYDAEAHDFDVICNNAPYYLPVVAAGNDRGSYNTGDGGYDLVNGHATSKNVMVVAAVNDVLSYTGPASVVMSSFSSWGPTDDGRIKPDISGNGVGLNSCISTSNTAYASYNGTSMASPNVTGTLTLLQQHYKNLNSGTYMKSSMLKAVAIHTAREAGSNPGPDYSFGWGLLDANAGAQVITNNGTTSMLQMNSLANNEKDTIVVYSNGTTPLKATIAWNDPAGTSPAYTTDNPQSVLVNDLDLKIMTANNATTYSPWTLNPSTPSAAATTGNNTRDNVEKAEPGILPAGTYKVIIMHKGTLASPQEYALVISGIVVAPPVCTVPTGLTIGSITNTTALVSWTTVATALTYDVQYRIVGSPTWTTTSTANNSITLSGLTPASNYQVQIRSVCGVGNVSAYTSISNFTTTSGAMVCGALTTGGATNCAGVRTVQANPSAGSPPYTYAWLQDGVAFGGNSQSVTTTSGTHLYSCTVTDVSNNVCTQTLSVTTVAIPTATASAGSACTGSTLNLTGTSNGATFTWTGPNAFSSSLQNPSIPAVTQANTGTYTFTAFNGVCASTPSTVSVTINNAPPVPAVTPSAPASFCLGGTQALTASISLPPTILSEGFETGAAGWLFQDSSSTGSAIASQLFSIKTAPYTFTGGSLSFTNFAITGTKFVLSNSDAGGSGSQTRTNLVSPSFSTVGYTGTGTLTFKHGYRSYSGSVPAEQVQVQASTDGGTVWTNLSSYTTNQGTTTNNAQTTVTATVTVPAGIMGQPNVILRWRYRSNWGYYWCIDDITLTGTPAAIQYAWSSAPGAGLPGAATSYAAGNSSVTATPTVAGTYNYVVTALSSNGCTSSATSSAVTVNPTTNTTTTASACNSYVWAVNNQTYTASGTYTVNNGCATNTLNLTITPSSTNTTNITAANSYTWPVNGQTYTSSGTYTHVVGCVTNILNLTITTSQSTLTLTAFIQGYYNSTANTLASSLLNQGKPNPGTHCDTVTVELHASTFPYAVVHSVKAILTTSGSVTCNFPGTVNGNSYYIAVKNRTAVETWSAAPVAFTAATSYNFSNLANKAYGNNMIQVDASPVRWAFYSGDIDQSGGIDGDDFNFLDVDVQAGNGGYIPTDLDGSGGVDGDDFNIFDPNTQNGIGAFTP
ncbi:MAG: S8 family serine peptidase [Chitinophagaceae bacterium]|nr:S8 family serine peptidase [Chitinophagaceae bacterium]